MNASICGKHLLYFLLALLTLAFLTNCSQRSKYHVFPAPIPDNAVLSLNYNAKGQLFFADDKGQPMKPSSFSELVKKKNSSNKEWDIEIVDKITIYKVTGSYDFWICRDGGECSCTRYNNYWVPIGPCN